MKNTQLAKEVFTLPKNYKYTDFSEGSYFGVFIGQEKQRFVIEVYEDSIPFAQERQCTADQKITEEDDHVNIEFTSTQYAKVLRCVLSCGCSAIPKYPKKLV